MFMKSPPPSGKAVPAESQPKGSGLPWLAAETLQILALDQSVVAEEPKVLELNLSFCRLEIRQLSVPLLFGERYLIKAYAKEGDFDIWVRAILNRCDAEAHTYDFCFLGIENEKIRTKDPYALGEILELDTTESFATACGRHPWFISEGLVFSVIGVFAHGLVLSEKLNRMNLLQVGEHLDLEIHFPAIGSVMVHCQIVRTYIQESHQVVQVEIKKMSDRYRRLLSRHLGMTLKDHPLDLFKNLHLPVPEYRYGAEVGMVFDEADERACLELRKRAYVGKSTSKLDPDIDPLKLKDRFDAHSLIMTVKVMGRIVGTGRLIFNNGDRRLSEVAQFSDLEPKYWQGGFVEASRFATNENFRRGDIFLLLVYLTYKIAHQSHQRYVIVECEENLVPLYTKLGARPMNRTVTHPMEGLTLHLVVFDVAEVTAGKIASKLNWFLLWAPAVNHLMDLGAVRLPPLKRWMVRLAARVPQDAKRKWLRRLRLAKA